MKPRSCKPTTTQRLTHSLSAVWADRETSIWLTLSFIVLLMLLAIGRQWQLHTQLVRIEKKLEVFHERQNELRQQVETANQE